ncbi:ATP-binding cassette domain-containing protein [Albimonas sp. CAU 1670]|uniref:amino acid ABC transporter ATP-binding/permease protein n=1 Tax=Albimonas sp. CAU 1670 TaxID=3032599 RepID=UPI0023D99182|nr:ATP-binding cassette domain-containing protein [Albimonas sp. CAU 1670]MDF2231998.1 ATP-binding cassette domain-containing protein [Albimonas sp. CAU 1670]
MRPLLAALRLLWRGQRGPLLLGLALSVCVLAMGGALLGLSGWFVTAAGAAGLAGAGLVFDVFRPAAGVRFLALGRTAARYGERLATHDATLRALAGLRVDLLRRQAAASWSALGRLRGEAALTRITADVDALDGLYLRLALPLAAGGLTLALAFALLAWLVDPGAAALICLGLGAGGAVALARAGRAAFAPSARAEAGAQRLRRRMIDLSRGRRDLVVFGGMEAARADAAAIDAETRRALREVDRIERRAGLHLQLIAASVTAGALALGAGLVAEGRVSAAVAALAVFAALGLAEVLGPLRRGAVELGRMRDAAARVMAEPEGTQAARPATAPALPAAAPAMLEIEGVSLHRPGADRAILRDVSLRVAAGEAVALTGPSGVGKSTLLTLAAGLERPDAGRLSWRGRALADWPEAALRAELAFLPQRSALVAGTILENLALARDGLEEAEAWAALDAAALRETVEARGGLHSRLGEGGAGLSGGESRRLALARTLLRRPALLLLDEPTEGLDEPTARRALAGIWALLPEAAILLASHRPAERAFADRLHSLD